MPATGGRRGSVEHHGRQPAVRCGARHPPPGPPRPAARGRAPSAIARRAGDGSDTTHLAAGSPGHVGHEQADRSATDDDHDRPSNGGTRRTTWTATAMGSASGATSAGMVDGTRCSRSSATATRPASAPSRSMPMSRRRAQAFDAPMSQAGQAPQGSNGSTSTVWPARRPRTAAHPRTRARWRAGTVARGWLPSDDVEVRATQAW